MLDWGKAIEEEARRCRKEPGSSLPPFQLLILEESFHFLLNEKFREEYSEALYGPEQLATKGFFASDPARGQKLLRRWGVIEIIPPRWDPARDRFSYLAQFPIPIVHWGTTGGDEAPVDPALNIRLLLMRQATDVHPVYLLACKRCGWLQGPIGSVETFWSKVPLPSQQLLHLVEARRDPSHPVWNKAGTLGYAGYTRPRRSERLGKLAETFADEVWGYDVAPALVEPAAPNRRSPVSGPLGQLLDEVSSPRVLEQGLPTMRSAVRRQRLRWKLLALALAQIQCQVCRRDGGIRFLLRYLTYIDADLSRATWKRHADALAASLQAIRERVKADELASRILWLPEDMPDPISHQIAGRIAQALDRMRLKGKGPQATARDLAVWVGNAARKGEQHWREHVEEELNIPVDQDDLYALVSTLRSDIASLVGDSDPGHAVHLISTLMHSERYSPVFPPIKDYYQSRIYPRILARRRHKVLSRSKLPRQ